MSASMLTPGDWFPEVTWAGGHVALDFDLSLHVGLHHNSLRDTLKQVHRRDVWVCDRPSDWRYSRWSRWRPTSSRPRPQISRSFLPGKKHVWKPWGLFSGSPTGTRLFTGTCNMEHAGHLLSAGLDGSGGRRTRSHSTLLRLRSELQQQQRGYQTCDVWSRSEEVTRVETDENQSYGSRVVNR